MDNELTNRPFEMLPLLLGRPLTEKELSSSNSNKQSHTNSNESVSVVKDLHYDNEISSIAAVRVIVGSTLNGGQQYRNL